MFAGPAGGSSQVTGGYIFDDWGWVLTHLYVHI